MLITRLFLFVACATSLDAIAQLDTATVQIVHGTCERSITLEELSGLPLHSAEVVDRNGEKVLYSGVWLKDALKHGCASIAAFDKHTMLRSAVVAQAADGYKAVVAMAETDSAFNAQPVLLAWERSGERLDERHGPFQLVVPVDRLPGRYVRQVRRFEVISY